MGAAQDPLCNACRWAPSPFSPVEMSYLHWAEPTFPTSWDPTQGAPWAARGLGAPLGRRRRRQASLLGRASGTCEETGNSSGSEHKPKPLPSPLPGGMLLTPKQVAGRPAGGEPFLTGPHGGLRSPGAQALGARPEEIPSVSKPRKRRSRRRRSAKAGSTTHVIVFKKKKGKTSSEPCRRPAAHPACPVGSRLTQKLLTCAPRRGPGRGGPRGFRGGRGAQNSSAGPTPASRLRHSRCPYPRWRPNRFRRRRRRFLQPALLQSAADNCLGPRAGDATSQWGRVAWSRPSGLRHAWTNGSVACGRA